MKVYALESKNGSVGFRSVVIIDKPEDLEKLSKSYNVEELELKPKVKKTSSKKKTEG
jgi:hypothetical protein